MIIVIKLLILKSIRKLMNYKKILVCLDGSKNSIRGLKMGIYLARQSDTKLTGILVLPKTPEKKYQKSKYPEKIILKKASKILDSAKTLSAKSGILFEHKISFGNPGQMIVKFAESLDYDVIIIGARGMGKIKEIFFGSTSHYVSQKSRTPILIVK